MENKYIKALRKSQRSISKRLWAAVALLLISSILISSVSYAWLVLSRAPEVSGVTSTIGSNGNLEIALATTEHLEELEQNNMYEPEGKEFIMATGDRVHDNVLWGNLVDLLDIEYGLHTLTMRPAILNVLDGKVAEVPVTVAGYGTDGRLEAFDPDNMDLSQIGVSAIFNSDTARCDFGTVTMTKADLEAGHFDKEAIVEDLLDNVSYGVRQAGPLDYVGRYDQETDNVSVDFYIDGYCFAIDLLLRTNAPMANLMLQTEAVQRMESQLEEEYQGQGSFIELANPYMTAAMSVVFADTLTGEVYAVAQANPEDGKLWITARMDENGNLVETAADDAAMIKPLVQNQISAITAWVFMNGALVNNASAATQGEMDMKLNLQFSTDAVLNPAYTDIDAEQNYPNRPDMELPEDGSTVPTTPSVPDIPSTDLKPADQYYLEADGESTYSFFSLSEDGSRDYELTFTGTLDSVNKTVVLDDATATSHVGLIFVPSLATYTADSTQYSVKIDPSDPFGKMVGNADYITFVPIEGSKVGITNTVLSELFTSICNECRMIDLSGLDTANVTSMAYMFYDCCNLTSLDVSSWDTGNVTSTYFMFGNCSNLTSLNVSGFDTGNVTDMRGMFYICSSLTSIDVSNWDTDDVMFMGGMFYKCSELTNVDVSNWNTLNVIDIDSAFSGCSRLENLDLGNWSISRANDAPDFLTDCTKLRTIVTPKNIGNVSVNLPGNYKCAANGNIYTVIDSTVPAQSVLTKTTQNEPALEDGTYYLEAESGSTYSIYTLNSSGARNYELPVTATVNETAKTLTISKVNGYPASGIVIPGQVRMGNDDYAVQLGTDDPFANVENTAAKVTILEVNGKKVRPTGTSLERLFDDGAYTTIDLRGLDTANVTNMSFLFDSCRALTTLDVSDLNTAKVTDMSSMFNCCNALTALDVSNWDTGNVSSMSGMFYECSKLTSLDVSSWDTSEVYDMNSVFFGCTGLTELDVSKWNTENVTNMGNLFNRCSALTELDIGNWDTATVTDMNGMFFKCEKLTELDVGDWDVGSVTNMDSLFSDCYMLTTLDVSKWNTENVENMRYLFSDCTVLPSVDVSGFKTSKVSDMEAMFDRCENLTYVDVSGFDTANVTNMAWMFYHCKALTSVDVSNFDTANVTNMDYMFTRCSELTSLDVADWNTSKVRYMMDMFRECGKLTSLDFSGWNMSNVGSASLLLDECGKLQTIVTPQAMGSIVVELPGSYRCVTDGNIYTAISKNVPAQATLKNLSAFTSDDNVYYFTEGATAGSYEIYTLASNSTTDYQLPVTAAINESDKTLTISYVNGYPADGIVIPSVVNGKDGTAYTVMLKGSPFTRFDRKNASITFAAVNNQLVELYDTTTSILFNTNGYTTFASLDVSALDTSGVTTMNNTFDGCETLVSLDIRGWDTSSVTDMSRMFVDCSGLTELDVSGFNTENVTTMAFMFWNCSGLTELNLSSFNTPNLTGMRYMFYSCTGLTELDLTSFNTAKVTDMAGLFAYCSNLTKLDISNFDTTNVTDKSEMFHQCPAGNNQ